MARSRLWRDELLERLAHQSRRNGLPRRRGSAQAIRWPTCRRERLDHRLSDAVSRRSSALRRRPRTSRKWACGMCHVQSREVSSRYSAQMNASWEPSQCLGETEIHRGVVDRIAAQDQQCLHFAGVHVGRQRCESPSQCDRRSESGSEEIACTRACRRFEREFIA